MMGSEHWATGHFRDVWGISVRISIGYAAYHLRWLQWPLSRKLGYLPILMGFPTLRVQLVGGFFAPDATGRRRKIQ